MIRTIKDLPEVVKYVECHWAVSELAELREWVESFDVDDRRCYSKSFEAVHQDWYQMMHEKLDTYGFVNGKPEENTLEKCPRAIFWWCFYCTSIAPYDHHCSSKVLKETMLNVVDKAAELI